QNLASPNLNQPPAHQALPHSTNHKTSGAPSFAPLRRVGCTQPVGTAFLLCQSTKKDRHFDRSRSDRERRRGEIRFSTLYFPEPHTRSKPLNYSFRMVAAPALHASVNASSSDAMMPMTRKAYPMANQRSKLRVTLQRTSSSAAPRQK